jgi:hypothetical protein
MSNNYRQFSVEIDKLNKKESAWLKRAIKAAEKSGAERGDPTLCETEWDEWGDNSSVAIFASEFGEIEPAVDLIHRFLKKFRPAQTIVFSWADTCDRMRPFEFGGGECLITADWIYWPPYHISAVAEAYQKAKLAGKSFSHDDALALTMHCEWTKISKKAQAKLRKKLA